MTNCREAQEQGKTFHYAWLLSSILLVARELPEDSQFPTVEGDLPEAARYTSLWAMKNKTRIREIKVFWVFVEASIRTWIDRRPHLSPTVYNNLQIPTEFKADMHNQYIRACKDKARTCVKLPFIAMDGAIFDVMASWSPEWHAPDLVELEKITAQQRKKETKLRMAQLAERKHQEQEAATQWKAAKAAATV